MKHPHAEVLHALAEGKPIEWKSLYACEWFPVAPGAKLNPILDANLEWRVKPGVTAADTCWIDQGIDCLYYHEDSVREAVYDEYAKGANHGDEIIISRAVRLPDLTVQLIIHPNGEIDWLEV